MGGNSYRAKTEQFRDAAKKLKLDLRPTPLGVIFHNPGCADIPGEPLVRDQYNLHGHTHQRRTCSLCGECDIGCNSGSKNTLDHTYLSQAEWYGAKIMPRCEADVIAPNPGGGYSVTYIERLPEHEGTRRVRAELPSIRITADQLVLAAGAIGSTYLLLRNKKHFPHISRQLGTRLSGNGDLLGLAVKHNVDGPDADLFHATHGPVITTSIRVPDQGEHNQTQQSGNQRGFYIQDSGFPNIASWVFHARDLPGAIWVNRRSLWKFMVRHFTKRPDLDAGAEVAALFGHNKHTEGMFPLLGMGRDIPNGALRINGKQVDLTFNWKHRMRRTSANYAYFQHVSKTMEDIATQMQARFTRSVHLRFRRAVTVHPLGGCPMGRTICQGVVNSYGEVFNYPGFFIADGSVMPGPVGPNPSLTIAALADRFADQVTCNFHAKKTFRPADQHRSNLHDPTTLRFTEELRGFIAWGEKDYERGFQAGRKHNIPLQAHLAIHVNGVNTFVADPQHRADICGYIKVGAQGEQWMVEQGDFSLCIDERNPSSLEIRYRLHLRDRSDAKWTLIGVKSIHDHPGFDIWGDSSTLFIHIFTGHVAPEQEQDAKIIGAGMLHLYPRDFLKQLTTFRAEGPILGARLGAYWAFGALFVSTLWKVYRARPKAHARRA